MALLAVQAEEVDARILSAIIAGVRRAFPFVATEDVQPLIEKHSDALFKMIHTAPFSVAVQALLLLFQLMSAQNAISDRFYRYSPHPTFGHHIWFCNPSVIGPTDTWCA